MRCQRFGVGGWGSGICGRDQGHNAHFPSISPKGPRTRTRYFKVCGNKRRRITSPAVCRARQRRAETSKIHQKWISGAQSPQRGGQQHGSRRRRHHRPCARTHQRQCRVKGASTPWTSDLGFRNGGTKALFVAKKHLQVPSRIFQFILTYFISERRNLSAPIRGLANEARWES